MKIIKPLRLGLLTRTFEDGPRCHLVLSALTVSPFKAPWHLLPEVALWKMAGKELGPNTILDEGMPKTNGEVLVYGSAYPKGGPAPSTYVRLTLGTVNKTLYVLGPRRFRMSVQSEPEPFSEMRISWENAFGGPGYDKNPLGKGYKSIKTDTGETHPLPNIEDPKRMVKSPGDRPDPVCFAALDLTWPQRQAHVGTYNDRWLKNRYPGYPEDFHWDFFSVAQPDQRIVGFFNGDERFKIENMHPSKPVLEGSLPGLVARCFVNLDREGGPVFREVTTKIDTVFLFPHLERMIVIHRGVTEVFEDDSRDVLQVVAAMERPGERRDVEHYERALQDRLDRKKPFAFVKDSELLPEKREDVPTDLPDDKLSDMEDLLARDKLLEENARRGSERRLEEVRKELKDRGLDPSTVPALPPPEEPPGLEEAPDLFDRLQADAERQQKEADEARKQADEEMRRVCKESGVDYDKMLADAQAKGPKRPPRFTARAEMDRLYDMKRLADNAGTEIPALEDKLADPALSRKLIAVEEHMFDVLRRFAHHMPPPEDNEKEVLEAIAKEVKKPSSAPRSFAGRDFTDADLSGLDLSGTDFEEALLERANLAGTNLAGANLTHAVLTRAKLQEANLAGARLKGANLGLTDLTSASLEGADLREAVLGQANLTRARFNDADLTAADLQSAVFNETSFEGVKAPEARFLKTQLKNVNFARAVLTKASFIEGRLEEIDFTGADLRSAVFFSVPGEGVRFDNANLDNVRFVNGTAILRASFLGAQAKTSCFRGAAFPEADLTGAVLDGSDLSECDFSGAKLVGASAKSALLIRTNLQGADLEGANLMEAFLQKTRVEGARLHNANLFRADAAKMRGDKATDLSGANVKNVRFVPDRRRDG